MCSCKNTSVAIYQNISNCWAEIEGRGVFIVCDGCGRFLERGCDPRAPRGGRMMVMMMQ